MADSKDRHSADNDPWDNAYVKSIEAECDGLLRFIVVAAALTLGVAVCVLVCAIVT